MLPSTCQLWQVHHRPITCSCHGEWQEHQDKGHRTDSYLSRGSGIFRKDKDRYVLQVLDTALGGGMSSIVSKAWCEEKGLVYSTYSYHSCYEDVGMVGVYAGLAR